MNFASRPACRLGMPTEENKALACMEIEEIWTKGNFAAAKGTGR